MKQRKTFLQFEGHLRNDFTGRGIKFTAIKGRLVSSANHYPLDTCLRAAL